jgi:hypothetical protein
LRALLLTNRLKVGNKSGRSGSSDSNFDRPRAPRKRAEQNAPKNTDFKKIEELRQLGAFMVRTAAGW